MYTHIMIATDGSELSERGVDQGLALARALGARATVLNVTVPLGGFAMEALVQGAAVDFYDAQVKAEALRLERAATGKAAAAGVAANFLQVMEEEPAAAILRLSVEKGCDLIVMASHAREGIERLVLGSQTAKVLAHSTLPVLVVR